MPRQKPTDSERQYLRCIAKMIHDARCNKFHELLKVVARRAKITVQYLWMIEHGRATNVSLLVGKRLAKALDIDEADLIRGKTAAMSPVNHHDAQLNTLLTQLSNFSESERTAVIISMLATLENYRRFVQAEAVNPQQLAFSFAASKREASRPRWFSARVSQSELPS